MDEPFHAGFVQEHHWPDHRAVQQACVDAGGIPHRVEHLYRPVNQMAGDHLVAAESDMRTGRFQQGAAAIGKAQLQALAVQQHLYAAVAGVEREQRVLADFGNRGAPVEGVFIRLAQDLAGPAVAVAPAFAAVVFSGQCLDQGRHRTARRAGSGAG